MKVMIKVAQHVNIGRDRWRNGVRQVTVAEKDPSLLIGVRLADLGGAAWSRLMSRKSLLNMDDGIASISFPVSGRKLTATSGLP